MSLLYFILMTERFAYSVEDKQQWDFRIEYLPLYSSIVLAYF